MDLPPYRIFGACNPSMAYSALRSEPRIGLMLPYNFVVRQAADGAVEVSAADPVAAMQSVGNRELAETALVVRTQLQEVIESLRGRTPS